MEKMFISELGLDWVGGRMGDGMGVGGGEGGRDWSVPRFRFLGHAQQF